MSTALYFREFIGFILQLMPCAVLIIVPFLSFKPPENKRSVPVISSAILMSLLFPFISTTKNNLIANIYMLMSILIVTALYMFAVKESPLKKLIILFLAVTFASVQFCLSNILMDILPLAKQDDIYNDATLAAYALITIFMLPPALILMRQPVRRYINIIEPAGLKPDLAFLTAVLILYLLLNALYSSLWVRLRDGLGLSFFYYIPFALLLTLLLFLTHFSTIRLSILKAENANQTLLAALMQQHYKYIEENMEEQKRILHDNRQLMRTLSLLIESGTKEEALDYINETMKLSSYPDTRFCSNSCMNGILKYYSKLAENHGIALTTEAHCTDLPFKDTDLTILIGNALENAIRSAAQYKKSFPDNKTAIKLTAGIIKDQFAVIIHNPCLEVLYSRSHDVTAPDNNRLLTAEDFRSLIGSGYGLKRMEAICSKYGGNAWFSYDNEHKEFTTKLMLSVNYQGEGKKENELYENWHL